MEIANTTCRTNKENKRLLKNLRPAAWPAFGDAALEDRMHDTMALDISLALNPLLDAEREATAFRRDGRVHISNVLDTQSAGRAGRERGAAVTEPTGRPVR